MEPICPNKLHECYNNQQVCKAFGIKTSTDAQTVLQVQNSGFDSLSIDLEHGWLSLSDTANLCTAALLAGITPFVRVPHQCGSGFVQRVLDGGAMGIIFPRIQSADDARAAVSICKYPPQGYRSMTGRQPIFRMKPVAFGRTREFCNKFASSVFAIIESREGVEAANAIAAVDGVDVLLVDEVDLAVDLGTSGPFPYMMYREAVEKVANACRSHNKILGVRSEYESPEVQDWLINSLGARFMMLQQQDVLIATNAARVVNQLPKVRQP